MLAFPKTFFSRIFLLTLFLSCLKSLPKWPISCNKNRQLYEVSEPLELLYALAEKVPEMDQVKKSLQKYCNPLRRVRRKNIPFGVITWGDLKWTKNTSVLIFFSLSEFLLWDEPRKTKTCPKSTQVEKTFINHT